jgi:hypothetical protein
MANTFIKIQTVTVGSGGASTIDFTSIPQTFTDLKLVMSTRDAYAGTFDSVKITFNSNTANYSYRFLEGTGAVTTSSNGSSQASGYVLTGNAATSTSSVFSNLEVYIPNYTSANHKSWSQDGVTENNATASYQYLNAQLWANTAAITSIQLTPYQPVNFVQYTTATLYGIKSS